MTTAKSMGKKGQYQKVKPVTDKNIGKSYLKWGRSRSSFHANGEKPMARRKRQRELIEQQGNAQRRRIRASYIKAGYGSPGIFMDAFDAETKELFGAKSV